MTGGWGEGGGGAWLREPERRIVHPQDSGAAVHLLNLRLSLTVISRADLGWLVCSLVGWLVGWLVVWLVGRLDNVQHANYVPGTDLLG